MFALALATAAPTLAQGAAQPVSIAEQPLADALVELALQYNIAIAAPATLTRGRTAARVSGNLTAAQAINRVLAGSGLTYRRSDDGYVVTRATRAGQTPRSGSRPARPQAQEEPQGSPIVVTGTKRNKSVQDTQTSVTVYTPESFEDQVAFELDDLFLRAPNISSSGRAFDLSIRGVARRGVSGTGGVTSNTFVDGAPLVNRSISAVDTLWDVAQIEILRGPQSTTQGRNALNGAVVIRTKDPAFDWEGAAQIRVGELGTRQYSGAISGPLVGDQLAFRAVVDVQEFEGDTVFADSGNDTFGSDTLTARAKLLLQPDWAPGLRAEFTLDYFDSELPIRSAIVPPGTFGTPEFEAFDPFGGVSFEPTSLTDTESTRGIVDIEFDVSPNWTLIALGTFEESVSDTFVGALALGDADGEGNLSGVFAETWTGELRAQFDYGDLTGWVGAYYYEEDSIGSGLFVLPLVNLGIPADPPTTIASFQVDFATLTDNFALFADLTYQINDRLSVNIGARYDREDRSETGNNSNATVNPSTCTVPAFGGALCASFFPSSEGNPFDASFEAFLPRATLIYDFSEDVSVSLGYQRGYRAGGSILLVEGNAIELRPFDPEFLDNFELAFRSEFGALTANANIFYARWSDQQISLPTQIIGFGGSEVVNAGESELYGAELLLEADITREFSAFATLGLLETEFIDFPFAVDAQGQPVNAADPRFANLAGNEFPFAPNIQASAGFSYISQSGFFASANINLSGEQASEVANLADNEGEGFVLANARIGYDFGNFRLTGYVNNLFNQRAILSAEVVSASADTGVVGTSFRNEIVPNRPRVFGVIAEARF